MKNNNQKGFSLVELSIVLVILGLLVGGVLGGQALIRSSELRSITVDKDKYVTGINTFKDKYMGLPGDISNAIAFWGAAHATPATCQTTASTGILTCDGNGDGAIDDDAAATDDYEKFRFWQQLSNAGLIEGSYNGISGTVQGTNIAKSRLSGGGFSMFDYKAVAAGHAVFFEGNYVRALAFGAATATAPADISHGPVLTVDEAWSLDTKIDDGKPGTGRALATETGAGTATGCASSTTAATAAYSLSNTGSVCSLVFITGL